MAERLAAAAWTELDGRSPLLLVPVGALEQHGPHLPCGTDALVATTVCAMVAERLGGDVLVAPTVSYGASGEHEGFPGTVSIGHEALHLLLVELGRSACRWAGRLVLVNGHGGNVATVRSAVTQLRVEGRDVAWTSTATPGADAHAGVTETSVLLHLVPDEVRQERLAVGATEPVEELLPALREGGVRAVSASGVLGDPRGASAAHGREVLESVVVRVIDEIGIADPDPRGRLRGTAR
ncbi:mycofactocin system creatininase family protein [Marmoricola endophyticus]|uniref:Mycofactocin system creatininase family protein n=1 Tax=Marmoricola endophyticus TaxID=2040280 RepID=A0A917BPA7_9ACTN|nr:mycofactocin biosynthesis peptidyl-dipeptidase MftE [Marmoricola endophyticus]GGF53711.1 mycofactocin system creatininase family protein [Marmoricola endophyticus]